MLPLSPMVQKRDKHGGQLPAHAILAFVDLTEKERFVKEFQDKSIVSPTVITMGEKGLTCRKHFAQKGSSRRYSPKRGNRESGRRSPGRGRPAMAADLTPPGSRSYEAPVGPGSGSYDGQHWPYFVPGWGHCAGNAVPRSYDPQQWHSQPYMMTAGYTPAEY